MEATGALSRLLQNPKQAVGRGRPLRREGERKITVTTCDVRGRGGETGRSLRQGHAKASSQYECRRGQASGLRDQRLPLRLASQTPRSLAGGSTVGRGEPGRSIRQGCRDCEPDRRKGVRYLSRALRLTR
jgi:hypothetical protein